VTEENYNSNNP